MRARHAGELVSFGGCLCFGDERDPQFACRRCHTRFGQVLPVFILPEGWTTSGKRRLCHGASAGLAGVGRRESRAWLCGWGGLLSAAGARRLCVFGVRKGLSACTQLGSARDPLLQLARARERLVDA